MRLATLALLTLTVVSVPHAAHAQWMVPVDTYRDVPFEEELRQQLVEMQMRDGLSEEQARLLTTVALTMPERVFLLAKFCEGCQTAHYWIINFGEAPLFAIDVHIELSRDTSGEAVERDLFLPVVPGRRAIRIGFPIPWPMQTTIEYRLGEPMPSRARHTTTVRDNVMLRGLPLSPSAVAALAENNGNFHLDPTDELRVGGVTPSVPFALDHVTDAERLDLARLYAAHEGGAELRELAIERLRRGYSTELTTALPEAELPAFAEAAIVNPGALARILMDTTFERAAALTLLLAEGPYEARDALMRAAIRTEEAERFALFAETIGDTQEPRLLARGWRMLEPGALMDEKLALLRALEKSQAHRDAAGAVVARRYLDGDGLPVEVGAELERLRGVAPDVFEAEASRVLRERGPLDAEALRAGSRDPYEFLTATLPALDGCNYVAPMLDSVQQCGEAVAADAELREIAAAHGLSAHFQARVRHLLGNQTDPGLRADVAEPLLAIGLDPGRIAEDMCIEQNSVMYDHRGPWIEAARRVDPSAACVVAADALIMGLQPLPFFILLGVALVLLLAAVLVVRAIRRKQKRIDAMMMDALEQVDDEKYKRGPFR